MSEIMQLICMSIGTVAGFILLLVAIDVVRRVIDRVMLAFSTPYETPSLTPYMGRPGRLDIGG